MKILIVPMAAMAETSGPSSRCRLLAEGFAREGFKAATCRAEDVNYRPLEGIRNYFLDVPMPLGLPAPVAERIFPIAQKTGISSRKRVDSFDQVLYLTGNLDYQYIKKSVESIRKAIREYRPHIVYSEFNIHAIVAALIERVTLYTTVSFPTQYKYASDPALAKGLNRYLREEGIPEVESALQLFCLADKSFCPSIPELEPIERRQVFFCGSMKETRNIDTSQKRNKIVVYMGNGSISAKNMKKVITNAFSGSGYEVYIASSYLEKEDNANIHTAARWDFEELLDEAVLFINHGGQNSIADGLIHGVPQIAVPGKVFERVYNARSIEKNNAGVLIPEKEFTSENIRRTAEELISSEEIKKNARKLGEKLRSKGGVRAIINEI